MQPPAMLRVVDFGHLGLKAPDQAMLAHPRVETLDLYLALMEEIKVRIEYVNAATGGKFSLPHRLVREFCFLQLRMIFELIALGCLCAHSRHANVKNLEKLWNTNELIARLNSLNPEFFPKAVTVKEMPWGFDCFDVTPPPITKKQFLNLYGRCGEGVHRGSLRKLVSALPSSPLTFTYVHDILRSIVNLLNTHRIPSPDLKTHYVCNMINGPGQKAAMITAQMQQA
jgi:hypothetical protein